MVYYSLLKEKPGFFGFNNIVMKKALFLFFLFPIFCFSQLVSFNGNRPKVLPASPSAAAFNKFGNYTVNLFHGLPDINIPIYEIAVKNVIIPIKIAYHASGIKVNDWGTNVGTGWVLHAGGNVSRRINGQADEYAPAIGSRWVDDIDQDDFEDYNFLQAHHKNKYDLEPDIFSYSLPGKSSGNFILNHKDGWKPVLIPSENHKIDYYLENGARYFKFVTDDGVIYHFRETEWTTSNFESGTLNCNTWQISSIITANLTDTIKFYYKSRVGISQRDLTDVTTISDDVQTFQVPPAYRIYWDQFPINSTSLHDIENQEKILDEIVFPNGKVVFEQSFDDRLDGFLGQKKLQGIKVYNKENGTYNLIKNISLGHGYFIRNNEPDTRRLKLNNIIFRDKQNAEIEKYSFEYNEETPMPNRLSRARDYWGYFNNEQNETLVPYQHIPFVNGPTGTFFNVQAGSTNSKGREVDSNYSKTYLIRKITYPTGGYTLFEFESNRYLENGTLKLAGGHRIKTIKSFVSSSEKPIVRTYKYGQNESGYGRANFIIDNYFFQSERLHEYYIYWNAGLRGAELGQTKRERLLFSNSSLNIEPFDGSPVTYREVAEYEGDQFDINGKTVYTFSDEGDNIVNTTIKNRNLIESNHLKRGQLLEKSVFKKVNNNLELVQKTENKYHLFKEYIYSDLALVVGKNIIFDTRIVFNATDPPESPFSSDIVEYNVYTDFNNVFFSDRGAFGIANYSIPAGIQKLVETINTTYDPIDLKNYLVTREIISYENNFLQPSSIEKTSSKHEVIKTEYKYSFDFSSNSIFHSMLNRNYITPIVEAKEVNLDRGITTNYLQYNYDFVSSGIIDKISFKKFDRSNSQFSTEISFDKYDNRGNVLQVTSRDGIITSYIYGHENTLPIAEVINALHASISYTSFESNSKGNWDYTGNVNTSEGITGSCSYYLNTGFIRRSDLNSSSLYTITYWKKDGSGNVNIGGTALMKKNGWTLYETTVSGIFELQISGNAIIDELRLYPKGAQMTTFAYRPLIGVLSQADKNNQILYYEYDDFNRLKLIRDFDSNIIKTFSYQYKAGQ